MEITIKEAKAIVEVLESGMPDASSKRDMLAMINHKLNEFINTN